MADSDNTAPQAQMRCTVCKDMLHRSGREPYRWICGCGRNFFAVFQLVEVASVEDRPLLLLKGDENAE